MITPQDLERNESSPRSIPTDFHGLVSLIFSYLRLFEVLVGDDCSHYKGVRSLRMTMVRQAHMCETIRYHSIDSILWEILIDVRNFFSTSFGPTGQPPGTTLSLAEGNLQIGTIKYQETAPYARLMGQIKFAPVPGFGGPMADNLFPPPGPAGRRAPGIVTERTNSAYFPKIKAAILHVLATYPDALANYVSLTLSFLWEVVPNTMSLDGVVYPGALIFTQQP
jgi:hypothetical protein